MDTYKSETDSVFSGIFDESAGFSQRIKEHLENVVSEDVYSKWINHFVFESIDDKKIIIAYYGNDSLKKFKRECKEQVWMHIGAVVGHDKKIKIYKRKIKKTKIHKIKAKKNIRVANFFVISMIFAAIALAVAVVGYNYVANRNFKEVFYNVSSLKADNKVRIIQISDLHCCLYGNENEKLIKRVEKLKPDLIIYTGDCLDTKNGTTKEVVNLCATLAKVAPSFYIYGNNEVEEYYDVLLNQENLDEKYGFNDDNRNPGVLSENADALEKSLETVGVKVLKNEANAIVVGTTKIAVYGVLTSNPSAFWSYAGESFDKFICENTDELKIMAVHEPFVFEEFTPESWGDVLICGHTHGGTIRVPMFGPLYTHEGGILPEREGDYVYGRYEISGQPLIVSSGLDNKSILRMNNQPELVIIDINRF